MTPAPKPAQFEDDGTDDDVVKPPRPVTRDIHGDDPDAGYPDW